MNGSKNVHINHQFSESTDPTAVTRKSDHIELAFRSQTDDNDKRFFYEPLFAAHPNNQDTWQVAFNNKILKFPIWISSMTGGTALAKTINYNLASACNEFGLGMGLGSCRQLLTDQTYFQDFNVRPIMGDDLPLFANLGIAQLEQLIFQKQLDKIIRLVESLQADGLIIHVNPLQEWLQPEGDRFQHPPIQTIETILNYFPQLKIIVKEVGQGMGYHSLRHLLQLPLAAIEFAAFGGTNFAKLELLRSHTNETQSFSAFANVGHNATEMVEMVNNIVDELGDKITCKHVIISGGIKNCLDGFYLINRSKINAIYGQASGFLKYAQGDYELLKQYISNETSGLLLAKAFLKI
ncbi:MAG: isopentenyl-diphosphate delta-isomerase [Saprospiraceae bacterium]|nr:isopentenyl-diphosphate delta-isomerase [Saprospiraceae bacterium]